MTSKTLPLRLAVDGRVLVMQPTGIGRYTRSLLRAMATLPGGRLKAVFFTHERIEDHAFWPGRFEQRVLRFPEPMLLRPYWDEHVLPGAIESDVETFDVYFSPLSVVPARLKLPSVATVHDLAFLRFPKVLPLKYRLYWRRAMKRTVECATRLIAVSASTRRDLAAFYPGSERKTKVVHEAPDPLYWKPPGGKAEMPESFRGLGRYFLAVGTLEPRKNYPFLLRVMQQVLVAPGCEELKLVIAGGLGWLSAGLQRQIAALQESPSFRDRIVWLEYVEFSDLAALYHGALALVFPTLYEGFGLPAVEAMAVGTPVVASKVSSLPEVVGEAGLLLPLDREKPWVESLIRIATSERLRREMSERGIERARRFSWERTARETWAVLEEAAGHR